MVETRKQAVSIRMNLADVRKIKKLAQRLGARDSDVIRFAVKNMLSRLAPLHDESVNGRNLVPVFVEFGVDMVRFFDLDAARLDSIINSGADTGRRVDHDDIVLMALMGAQMPYAALLLKELDRSDATNGTEDGAELATSLRQYLYEKYVYRTGSVPVHAENGRSALTTMEFGPQAAAAGAVHD